MNRCRCRAFIFTQVIHLSLIMSIYIHDLPLTRKCIMQNWSKILAFLIQPVTATRSARRIQARSHKGACLYRINKDPLKAPVWSHKRPPASDHLAFRGAVTWGHHSPRLFLGATTQRNPGTCKEHRWLDLPPRPGSFSQVFVANSLDFVRVRVLRIEDFFSRGVGWGRWVILIKEGIEK